MGGPGAREGPARSRPRTAPAGRPASLPARVARRAHRVLLLHHLVHLLGNADHLVLHGSRRSSPRPARLGREVGEAGAEGTAGREPGAGLAHHSRPGPRPFLTTKPAAASAACDSDSAPTGSANRASRAPCRHCQSTADSWETARQGARQTGVDRGAVNELTRKLGGRASRQAVVSL